MKPGRSTNAVTVACAWLPQPLAAATRATLLSQLPYARRLQMSAAADRQSQSLLGVALACELLSALTQRALRPAQLRYTAYGKPYATGFPDFSIAHAGAWVVCAVASAGTIGIDVEILAYGGAGGALAAWSAREATVKAAGARLHDLPRVHGSGRRLHFRGQRWYGHAPPLTPGTILRVVSSLPIAQFRLQRRPAARVVAWQEARR